MKEILGQCQCCECDVTTDQDYLKLKTGPGAGRIYCEEHVGWGECQKAWSGSCGCDVCADEEENEDDIVGCCEKCDMEIVRDSEDHDNCLIIDGGDSVDKFCCQSCGDMKTCEHCEGAVSDEGGKITVLGVDITICENCDTDGDGYDGWLDEYHYNAETNDYEEKEDEPIPYCYENGKYSAPIPCGCPIPCRIPSSDDESEEEDEQNECEICGATSDINDDWHGNSVCDECFMCCEECSNTKNPAVFEKTASDLCECEKEDSDEVKQYKAVLAETLRYEAIMDMMKKK